MRVGLEISSRSHSFLKPSDSGTLAITCLEIARATIQYPNWMAGVVDKIELRRKLMGREL